MNGSPYTKWSRVSGTAVEAPAFRPENARKHPVAALALCAMNRSPYTKWSRVSGTAVEAPAFQARKRAETSRRSSRALRDEQVPLHEVVPRERDCGRSPGLSGRGKVSRKNSGLQARTRAETSRRSTSGSLQHSSVLRVCPGSSVPRLATGYVPDGQPPAPPRASHRGSADRRETASGRQRVARSSAT